MQVLEGRDRPAMGIMCSRIRVTHWAVSLCSMVFLSASSSLPSSKDGRPSLETPRAMEGRVLGWVWREGSRERERERERDILPAPPRPVEYYKKD